MIRNTKYKRLEDNVEVCVFPLETFLSAQGPGFNSDGSVDMESYSHTGSWAIDNSGDVASNDPATYSDVFAPVKVELVYISTAENEYNTCIYSSVNKVLFPGDDIPDYLDLALIHCEDEYMGDLNVGDIFEQGEWIYKEGLNGGPDMTGAHVHMEARKRGTHTDTKMCYRYFDATGNPATESNYFKRIWALDGNEPLQTIFFKNETNMQTTLPTISGVPDWQEMPLDEMLIERNNAFDPTNKADGWYTHDGETYYVVNEECLTGKHTLEEPGGADEFIYIFDDDGKMLRDDIVTYGSYKYALYPDGKARINEWFLFPEDSDDYYYAQSNGRLAKNKWVAAGSDWYYLGSDCIMARDEWVDGRDYYVDEDGVMLIGWHQLRYPGISGRNYFYLNDPNDFDVSGFDTGQKVTNSWVASGSSWYYLKATGIMTKNETLTIGGTSYSFDANGACMNP